MKIQSHLTLTTLLILEKSNNRPLGSEEPDDITANEDDFDDVFGNPESEDESLNKDDKN